MCWALVTWGWVLGSLALENWKSIMASCSSGKRGYVTESVAKDALIEARTRYGGEKEGGPVAVYRCDDCGQFHLTSKGTMNPKLTAYIKEGKLKLNQEAGRWMEKLKRK